MLQAKKKSIILLTIFTLLLVRVITLFHPVPGYAPIYCKRAMIHLKKNEITQAISQFDKAVFHDPTYAESYYQLGLLYEMQNNREKELINFKKVVDLNAEDKPYAKAYFETGKYDYEQGQYIPAILSLRRSIFLDQNFLESYNYLGRSYFKIGDILNAKRQAYNLNSRMHGSTEIRERGQPILDDMGQFLGLETKNGLDFRNRP